MNTITRISEIEILNIKNVERGIININNETDFEERFKKSDLVGIYGQNGSGKTAFVDAMWIVKHLLSGESLPKNTSKYIFNKSNSAKLKISFKMLLNNVEYTVFYDVVLKKVEDDRTIVEKENLDFKDNIDNIIQKRSGIVNFDTNDSKSVFRPDKNLKILTRNNREVKSHLGAIKILVESVSKSFIFSDEFEKLIENKEGFEKYYSIILKLKKYAQISLFIIKNSNAGMINSNILIPFNFRFKKENTVTRGEFSVGLTKPTIIPEEIFTYIEQVIKQLNEVIKEIIPGLNIGIKNYGKQLNKEGKEEVKIELVSIRNGMEIPLRYESDGTKKIISILNSMISVFNNPTVCLIVDELDAGIFEYLLGEILNIINETGKGQLIFTSHNLRPLEMLDANDIVFTTTNPNNRYINFSNVKANNNLRNLYYRSINLGGQKENIYEETNKYDISMAFSNAWRNLNEN